MSRHGTSPKIANGNTIHLNANDSGQVLLTPQDFDRFMMTQREVVEACQKVGKMNQESERFQEQLVATVKHIATWCSSHNVKRCLLAPRADDIMVVVIAPNDDEGGKLHDEMAALDLEMFERNGFRLYWLLLRASESEGLDAFIDAETSFEVFGVKS